MDVLGKAARRLGSQQVIDGWFLAWRGFSAYAINCNRLYFSGAKDAFFGGSGGNSLVSGFEKYRIAIERRRSVVSGFGFWC